MPNHGIMLTHGLGPARHRDAQPAPMERVACARPRSRHDDEPSAPFPPGGTEFGFLSLSGSSATFGLMTVAPAFRAPPGSWEASPLPAATPIRVVIGMSSPTSDWMPSLDLLYAPGSLGVPPVSHGRVRVTVRPFGGELHECRELLRVSGSRGDHKPARLMFSVSGPAEAMGHVFHTEFVEYSSGAGTFFTHTTAASLPAGLGISGVLGLGNATPVLPALGPGSTAFSVLPDSGSCGTTPPFAPCAVQGAYNETPLLKDGTNGTGVRIGIVDDYDGTENQSRLAADLATFGGIFNISTGHVQYLYPVPTTTNLNTTDTGWAEEEALDLEWAHATAPGASIDMTFAPDASEGLYSAVDYLVAHQAVDVLSLSWGEPDVGSFNNAACTEACNATSDGTYTLLHPVLLEAAMEGISVLAATGDCGAADGTNGVSTNYPASDPWVTAVGATDLSARSFRRIRIRDRVERERLGGPGMRQSRGIRRGLLAVSAALVAIGFRSTGHPVHARHPGRIHGRRDAGIDLFPRRTHGGRRNQRGHPDMGRTHGRRRQSLRFLPRISQPEPVCPSHGPAITVQPFMTF